MSEDISEDEKRISETLQKLQVELGEYCNAVLIVVSFDKGQDAGLRIKTFGPNSHVMGLAHYAVYEIGKNWDVSPTEITDD